MGLNHKLIICMKKSDIVTMPEYFDRYINLVDDINLNDALMANGLSLLNTEKLNLEKLANKVYEPGKWTVNDILQHIIDTERIFIYRALRFARNDNTVLPGFDENTYAVEAKASNRTLESLIHEFDITRQSSICFFKSLDEVQLLRTGNCFNKNISVLAIGFTLAGHLIHHLNVIKERYYPLILN